MARNGSPDASVAPSETARGRALERGTTIEGYAFTFCKAAFLALLFWKYTLLICATTAAVLYVVAALYGVREWRCFVKPPWVVIFFGIVAAVQAYFLFWRGGFAI